MALERDGTRLGEDLKTVGWVGAAKHNPPPLQTLINVLRFSEIVPYSGFPSRCAQSQENGDWLPAQETWLFGKKALRPGACPRFPTANREQTALVRRLKSKADG